MKTVAYPVEERKQLPSKPGVYRFYNLSGDILYVGKANNLFKRVNSYFKKTASASIKLRQLVKQIHSVSVWLVNDPDEALLLENNFIKTYQPRYNALLKDDKTFPSLCLTNEPFPRLLLVRQRVPGKGTYFGPFTQLKMIQEVQGLIRQLYTLRTCSYDLSAAKINKKKYKVCLEYHIKHCLGPCEGKQSYEDYLKEVREAEKLLKGNFAPAKKRIHREMLLAANQLNFEIAERKKKQLQALEAYRSHTVIVHPKWGDLDVVVLVEQADKVYVSYLRLQKGQLIFAQTVSMQPKLEENRTDLLVQSWVYFRSKSCSTAKEVISSHKVETPPKGIAWQVPQKGDKKRLLELALKNAFFFRREQQNKRSPQQTNQIDLLNQLQKDLRLPTPPHTIECFDNAHLQGNHTVSSMVTFQRGAPYKKGYRRYKLKRSHQGNDYSAMQEVLERRYRPADPSKSDAIYPDLLIIDGGKGQLQIAQKVLKQYGLGKKISVISIAKRLEEIYYPNDPYPLHLDRRGRSLRFLQRVRDEAHRFATQYYKLLHEKESVQSVLDTIPGIGSRTIAQIRAKYTDMNALKAASKTQLVELIGGHRANILHKAIHI